MEFGKGEAFAAERREIAARIRTRSLDEWIPELQAAEIPFAPVPTVQEALASDHAEVSGIVRETTFNGHTLKFPASPVRVAPDDSGFPPPDAVSAPPAIGEHTDALLHELGLR